MKQEVDSDHESRLLKKSPLDVVWEYDSLFLRRLRG